jgi:hypothetical protein
VIAVAEGGSTSTRPRDVPFGVQRRHRTLRRAGLVAIGALVLAGSANLVGLRLESASARAGGTSLEVTYALVTRPGLATPWRVEVRRAGGFEGPITISTTTAYFESFDFNQWYPEPTGSTVRADELLLRFDPPEGDVFTLRFDGRATPTFNLGSGAVTTLETPGSPVLRVEYRTVVVP